VTGFAVVGAMLEWLHPGLVSDVLPWSVVAGLAIALALGLAWRTRPALSTTRWSAVVLAAIVAAVVASVAYGYFAPIPRFQLWLSLAAGVTVLLGACLFIYRQPQP
jgi:heme A synthase